MDVMDRAWPVSDVEHEAWFAALAAERDRVYFAIERADTGQHIGNVWLWGIDWRHRRAEVRIVIGEPAECGRGSGSQAIDAIARYAFARLNLHKLIAYVLATNAPAQRAFEKACFEREATLKEDRWANTAFVDVHLLSRFQWSR